MPRLAILSPMGRNPGRSHGGITPVVRDLANGWAAMGHAVDLLVTPPRHGWRPPEGLAAGVRPYDLRARHTVTTLLSMRRYLRRERPDALLAAGHRYNKVAAWAARLPGAPPTFLGVHNSISTGLAATGPLRRRQRIAALRRLYPWADGIIAVSAGVAEDFCRVAGLPRTAVTVIHNPIDIDAVRTRAAASAPTHPWLQDREAAGQWRRNPAVTAPVGAAPPPRQPPSTNGTGGDRLPVVVALGRLSRQKDFPTLLQAIALLQPERPCRLVILGEGDARPALEAQVRELGLEGRVDLPGFRANPYPELARADCLALSSAWEGFGNVLVEALALGVPVAATDCPSGPREILADGRYGPLVPVADAAALAEAIRGQLDDPVRPADPDEAVAAYRPERVAERYLEVMGVAKG